MSCARSGRTLICSSVTTATAIPDTTGPDLASWPLTPLQEGLLFHTVSAPDDSAYVEQLHCRLDGELDLAAFEYAWQQAIACHDILRAGFAWTDGRPAQRVETDVPFTLTVHDWRDADSQEQGVRFQPALGGTLQLSRTAAFYLGGGKALLNAYYRTAAKLGIVRKALAAETDPGVKPALEQVAASLELKGGDRASRIAARAGGYSSARKRHSSITMKPSMCRCRSIESMRAKAARRWRNASSQRPSSLARHASCTIASPALHVSCAALASPRARMPVTLSLSVTNSHSSAMWILAFTCFRLATMVKVMITSSDQELHLLMWTTDQAPSWLG